MPSLSHWNDCLPSYVYLVSQKYNPPPLPAWVHFSYGEFGDMYKPRKPMSED